jgi:hypothetical protein
MIFEVKYSIILEFVVIYVCDVELVSRSYIIDLCD